LTEPDRVSQWFPANIEGERRAGAPLTFVFREDEGPTLGGEVLAFEPPRLFEFTWQDEHLRFELVPTADGCRLTFLNTFDDVGKAARDAAGWHACLDLLPYAVTGDAPPWDPSTRWSHVQDDYIKRFPPEASTVGPPEEGQRAQDDSGSAK
jgi:hypothetical protein